MALPLDELIAAPALVNQRAQDLDWDDLLFEYERALDDMQALLGGLSEAQVHFKPSAQDYSIAEVMTHAAHGDQFLLEWVKQLAADHAPDESNWRDMTRGADNSQALDQVRGSIETSRLLARAAIDELPDPGHLELTARHPYFGALNAKGWLYFLAIHRGTHLHQCGQVIDAPGFPRADSRQSLSREEYLQPSGRKTWLEQEAKGKPAQPVHTRPSPAKSVGRQARSGGAAQGRGARSKKQGANEKRRETRNRAKGRSSGPR
jgi:hypothetical protein